eukprot:gene19684-22384_t
MPPLGQFPCLSEDGLNMVKELMLAQAQLCFYEKAVQDKKKGTMKSPIVAKLAKQTSVFYHNTSVACKVGVLGSMLDSSWFAVTDFQCKCFQGAAEYWQAHASKEAALATGTGYGEEVARFNRADTFVALALAQTSKYSLADSLTFGANGLRQAIQQHRQSAEHDLRTVYMESVPADSSLAEITSVSMVRPAALPELTEPVVGLVPLFRYVLPQHIRAANVKYQDEVTTLLQHVSASAEGATNAARNALSAKGLPGSLEAAKTENPLPPSLWTKVQRVQAMGGAPRLASMFEDLKATARRALQTMATIDESLDREDRTDAEFRRLNPDFPGTSSRVLSADVRTNNTRMREAYANAQQSDKLTEEDLHSDVTVEQLSIVSKSQEELLELFPRDNVNLFDHDEHLDKKEEDPAITKLEDKLHELAALIEARTQHVATFKAIVAVDITEATNAALAQCKDITALHAENLQQAGALHTQVMEGVTKQNALLAEIMQLNEVFEKSRVTNAKAVERQKVIQTVEQSVAKFSLIHSQVTAGITFYTSLQAKLTTLMQSTDDLAYTQQWQRQDFGAQKSSELDRNGQEMTDRDYALQLSNELNASPRAGVAAIPQQAQYAPPPAFQPAPQAAAAPANTAMVYGTPVSGPPANLMPMHAPAPAQQAQHAPQGGYMATFPAAVPGGPSAVPAQVPGQGQYPAQYQQQYQSYGAPVAAQNPAYNPYAPAGPVATAASAAVPPPANHYAQQQPPQPVASNPHRPQSAHTSYGAYPAMPAMAGQPAPAPYAAVPAPVQGGGYQYNNASYNTTSPAQSPGNQASEFDQKTMRLCEMGFPMAQCAAALTAYNGDPEAALNALLTGTVPPPPPTGAPAGAGAPPAAGAPAPEKPAKPSGLFGKMWGSK